MCPVWINNKLPTYRGTGSSRQSANLANLAHELKVGGPANLVVWLQSDVRYSTLKQRC